MEEHPINKFRGGIPKKDPDYIHCDEFNQILADFWNEFQNGVKLAMRSGSICVDWDGPEPVAEFVWMENGEIQSEKKQMKGMDLIATMIGFGRVIDPPEKEEEQ